MSRIPFVHPIPKDSDGFESLCLFFFRKHWNVPDLKRYGRKGHKQHGGDLIGTDDRNRVCFIQCKRREVGNDLSIAELQKDIASALQMTPKVERFAFATTAKRDPGIQAFCVQRTKEHQESGLFTVEPYFWDDIDDVLNEDPELSRKYLGRSEISSENASISQQVRIGTINGGTVNINMQQTRPEEVAPGYDLASIHAEIDEAASHNKTRDYSTTLVLLDKLEKRLGGKCDDRCRYRIHANRGHAQRFLGNLPEAAKEYLAAKQFQPKDENARTFEALAHSLLGDNAKAHQLAEALVKDFAELTTARAIWVNTAPQDIPFETLEEQIPRHQRKDGEVALALAGAAEARRAWDAALSYGRVAVASCPAWPHAKLEFARVLYVYANDKTEVFIAPLSDTVTDALREAVRLLQDGLTDLGKTPQTQDVVHSRTHLALCHSALDQDEDADREFTRASALAPNDPDVAHAYAGFLAKRGHRDKAIATLRGAVQYPHGMNIELALVGALHRSRISRASPAFWSMMVV